jgi:hypothetical protein
VVLAVPPAPAPAEPAANDGHPDNDDPLVQQSRAIARLARQVRRLADVTDALPERVAAAMGAAAGANGGPAAVEATGAVLQEHLDRVRESVTALRAEVSVVASSPVPRPTPPAVATHSANGAQEPEGPPADGPALEVDGLPTEPAEAAEGPAADTADPLAEPPSPAPQASPAPPPTNGASPRTTVRDRILGLTGRPQA